MQIRIIIDFVLFTAVCLPQFELRYFHQQEAGSKSKFIQRDHGRSWKFAENVLTLRQSKMYMIFFSSSEQIWKNLALHHLLTNGSSAVNGCRQNESPNIW